MNHCSVINAYDPGVLMSRGRCVCSWEMVGGESGAWFEWQPTESGRRPQKSLCVWTRPHAIFESWVIYDSGTNKSRNDLTGYNQYPRSGGKSAVVFDHLHGWNASHIFKFTLEDDIILITILMIFGKFWKYLDKVIGITPSPWAWVGLGSNLS